MFKCSDIVELSPDKAVYEGDALAKVEGFPVFVQGGCPGDRLKVKIVKANKNYANAVIEEILEPSPHRVKPFWSAAQRLRRVRLAAYRLRIPAGTEKKHCSRNRKKNYRP